MGVYQSDYWQSSGWGMNRRETQSGTYHPYLPDFIADHDFRLTAQAARAIAHADAAVRRLNATSTPLTDTEPLARLILRSEALASSRIEGLYMSAGRLLEYEALDDLGVSHRLDSVEAAVIGNINAMQTGIERALEQPSVTVDSICEIHRQLLAGTTMADRAGTLRTEQNWIGGNNVNPVGAAYVPPRPCYVPDLMDDLARFCNTTDLPALAAAAVAHAQLETIHPFADGNGRTGRALVHLILKRGNMAERVVPPLSLVLATDKSRYISNLAAYRTDRNDPNSPSVSEAASDWIEFFCNACLVACERAEAFEERIAHIQDEWRKTVAPRKNSAADLLIAKLPCAPVVSVQSAARLIGRSREAARVAIRELRDCGVLVQSSKNRKSDIYAAQAILDAFTQYERSLATPSGDTSFEKPERAVPARVPRERRG